MPNPKACERCGATFESSPALDGLCAACLFKASLEPELVVTRGSERRPAPTISSLAPHFPDLEILELIGHGGMGAVYRVRQKSLGRDAALKVLALDSSSDPAFGERFERESRLLASLAHPNIVSVYSAGRAGPHWYLLMELVEGASLRQLIAARELDPRSALAIVGQVCDALQAAHDRGVVHRDIKPENVIVTRQGTAKILDFGLAKLVGQGPRNAHTLTETGQVMGTVRYMAPEQWDRPLSVDHRADIYSLGVVMYELLTGELPMGRFPLPSKKAPVGANVDDIVLKTLEKEPEQRYQHASDVRADVDRAANSPQSRAAPTAATQATTTPKGDAAARAESPQSVAPKSAPLSRALLWTAVLGGAGLIALIILAVLSRRLGWLETVVLSLVVLVPVAIAVTTIFSLRRGAGSETSRAPTFTLGCLAALLLFGFLAAGSALLFGPTTRHSALEQYENAQRDARAALDASTQAELEHMPLITPGEVSTTELRDDGRGSQQYSGVVRRELQAQLAPFARIVPGGSPETMARARWAFATWALHASLLDDSVMRDKSWTEGVVTYRIPALAKQLERNRKVAVYLFLNLDYIAAAGALDSENFTLLLPAGKFIANEDTLYWRFDLKLIEAALNSIADRPAFEARLSQALNELELDERMEFGREEWWVEVRDVSSPNTTARITLPDGRVRELDTAELNSRYGLLKHLAR